MIDSTRMIPKTHQDKTRPISEYHHYSRSILALGGTNCDKSIYPGVAGEGIFLLLSSVQVASTVRSCCHCELRLRAIFGYLLLLFAGKKSMVVRTRYLASSFVVFFVCITASSYSRPREYVDVGSGREQAVTMVSLVVVEAEVSLQLVVVVVPGIGLRFSIGLPMLAAFCLPFLMKKTKIFRKRFLSKLVCKNKIKCEKFHFLQTTQ